MSKHNIIAGDFNIKDTLLTHIGIGYYDGNNLTIFNMSPTKTDSKGSNLIVEGLAEFIDYEDILYFAVYEVKADSAEISKMKKLFNNYRNKVYLFDQQFVLFRNEALYCSELVAKTLFDVNPERFKIRPTIKKLNYFYSNMLKVNNFTYIPVDFFLDLPDVRIVSEKFY